MTTLPGPDERIAELVRVLTAVSRALHTYHRDAGVVGAIEHCDRLSCRDATRALAGDYVKERRAMTPDEVWATVQAEVADMAAHIGNATDPMAGFTPMQRTVVRIYVVNAWRMAQRDLAAHVTEVANA